MKLLLLFGKDIILFVGFLNFVESVFAGNLLQNTDFELGELAPWTSSGGSAQATISSEVFHGGKKSLKISHSKVSSYGYQQTIPDVEGGMFYQIEGFGSTTDNTIANYFIRTAWYSSSDGSGSQLSSPNDTDKCEKTDGTWTQFTETMQAPLDAKSAKLRLVISSKIDNSSAFAYFDDILFQESVAPTSTPTPTPTLAPTPTPTRTPTPSPTQAPTSTPTHSPTPTPTVIRKPTSDEGPSEAVLRMSTVGDSEIGEKIDMKLADGVIEGPIDSVLGTDSGAKKIGKPHDANSTFAVVFGFLASGLAAFSVASTIQTVRGHSSKPA